MKRFTIVISIIIALLAGGALLTSNNAGKNSDNSPTKQSGNSTPEVNKTVTKAELAQANGKNGQRCWVAVDGTVYQIDQGFQWQNGRHIPSGGRAYCGADLSNVINQAPHGRTVLGQLQIVGKLGS